ncbi:SIR2 family NAD-dependent protein deacylase [Salinimonas iocasae]|uniref:Deacetylase sirtuin-type domain-containing protein n=1 Tax=Salinimonas iocasae TaxID=2572577 RepID=A0A5B7YFX0_9ALTE|nr:hypothetical protein [Salinimonas iocasae]QCZ94418.1 hypothetical protein FBQ74_13500 [Salinimonas iocasae]
MRIVLISGAGLSSTSGAPTYNDISRHPLYTAFTEADNDEAVNVAQQISEEFDRFRPGEAHRECVLIENVCSHLGIPFIHYTLNVDTLIEQAKGTVTHIYGSLQSPASLVEYRFTPQIDLTEVVWQPDDIVLFLGVSGQGLPLAYIETCIESTGGKVFHYNLQYSNELVGSQIVGDLLNTFSCAEVLSHLPLTINIADNVDGDGTGVEFAEFTVSGNRYIIFFTPYNLMTVGGDMLASGAQALDVEDSARSFEVKFDLSKNYDQGTYFDRPPNNLGFKEMNILGQILLAYISSHYACSEIKPSMYVAEAQYPKLNAFYKRLAKYKGVKLRWTCELIENLHNSDTGDFYAFKPNS